MTKYCFLILSLSLSAFAQTSEKPCTASLFESVLKIAEKSARSAYYYLPYALSDAQARKMNETLLYPIVEASLDYDQKCFIEHKRSAKKKHKSRCQSLSLFFQYHDLVRLRHDFNTQVPGEIGTFSFLQEERTIYMTPSEMENTEENFIFAKDFLFSDCLK